MQFKQPIIFWNIVIKIFLDNIWFLFFEIYVKKSKNVLLNMTFRVNEFDPTRSI